MDAQTYINELTANKLNRQADILGCTHEEEPIVKELKRWKKEHELYGVTIDYETLAKRELAKWVDAQYYGAAKDMLCLLSVMRDAQLIKAIN